MKIPLIMLGLYLKGGCRYIQGIYENLTKDDVKYCVFYMFLKRIIQNYLKLHKIITYIIYIW